MTKKQIKTLKEQNALLFNIALNQEAATFHKIGKIVYKIDTLIEEIEQKK